MSGVNETMRRRRQQKEEAQDKFLAFRASGLTINEALDAVGRSNTTLDVWLKDPRFKGRYQVVTLGRKMEKDLDDDGRDSFAVFRKLWFKHDSPWFHLAAIEAIEAAQPGSVTLILFHPEAGKGLGLSTPVPTPDGWVKMGELKVGDYLFGKDGHPTRVTGIFERGVQPMRRVHFADGTSLDCDVEHLWFVRDRHIKLQNTPRQYWEGVLSTQQMEPQVALANDGRAFLVPLCEPLQMEDRELPLDPWALGYWLGNGTRGTGNVTTHTDDEEFVRERYLTAGFGSGPCRTGSASPTFTPYGLYRPLRDLGVLDDKHVPEEYLWASEDQRRALLAGLMDSDGHAGSYDNRMSFTSTRSVLADAVEFLVRSLGLKPTRQLNEARYKVDGAYKITGDLHLIAWTSRECPATSPRKTASFAVGRPPPIGDLLHWRAITSIEELPAEEVRCITVDATDALYLAGDDLIVTHNTTLAEDYICHKLAVEPTHRFIVGSEKHTHAKKMVGRIKNRMEPGGPFPGYVAKWGPFAPQLGDDGYQPWGADFMNVRRKGNEDERDYSLAALGFGAGIIGTRTDTLFVDDPQSTKTLSQTESMIETFRQDWLSRPGAYGKTVVWGSRVGEDDFYQGLLDADIVDNYIMFPAHNSRGEWLWPERYSPEQYARLRKNVGEAGWQRNYMMRPQAAGESKFTQEMLDTHADPLRAVWTDPPADTAELAVGVDPGFGINATMVAAFCPGRMVILNGRTDHNLRNNQEIVSIVGEMIDQHRTPEKRVSQVIMEDKAFQKGLLNDESLIRLRERHGFSITGHQTGSSKNDEDFGVASMAAGFLRGEIVLPGSKDVQTVAFREALDAELKAWRPRRRGTQLKQDMVMSLWFLWLLWRRRRDFVTLGPSNWDTGAVPFNTQVPQLIVPVGAGGWSR